MTSPLPHGVARMTRAGWHAEPPRSTLRRFDAPAAWLFVHHTVTAVTADAADNFAAVQRAAFGRGFADVSYGELIGPDLDGTVVVAEGRGVQWVGAHTVTIDDQGREKDLNRVGIGVAFVGNYHPPAVSPPALPLTDLQVAAFRWLRGELVDFGWLTPDHAVILHRGVYPTACAGDTVAARLGELAAPLASTPLPPPAPHPSPTPSLEEALAMQPFVLIHASGDTTLFVAGQRAIGLGGLEHTYGGLISGHETGNAIARPIGPVPDDEAAQLRGRWNEAVGG